jgi:hypothetical protein
MLSEATDRTSIEFYIFSYPVNAYDYHRGFTAGGKAGCTRMVRSYDRPFRQNPALACNTSRADLQ